MKIEKNLRLKAGVGAYCLTIKIEGEPDLALKVNDAITKETKTWKDIKEV